MENIQRDIRALHDLDKFRNIQVEKESRRGGVALIYILEEKAIIEAVEIEGNKKIKDDDLMGAITVKPFTGVDPAEISFSIQKMKEKYVEKGYHLASIRHSLKPIPNSKNKMLVFTVQENQGVKVKRINITGNKAFSDKKLRKVIRTKQKTAISWLTSSGKYQREVLERDVAFLTFHYLNNGYLRARVSAPEVYLSRDKKWLYIDFHVEEGDQYTIGNVDIAGDILTTREEFLGMIETKSGDIYSRKIIEQDIIKMTEKYGNQAYAFASINPATIPNDEALTADITFQIDKGRKIKIERINISGNTTTRDKVVRRELEVVENGYYHEGRLRRSRERLMALGFFEDVNFATPRGSTDEQIILNIQVKEKQTGTFSIGAGFSSVENFILTASVSKDNLMGYGINGRFSLELSSRRQLFLLSFSDPYFLDTNWIFSASGYRTVNVFEDFDRRSFGGNVNLGRRVFDHSRILFGYEVEDVEAEDFRTTIPALFEDNLSGLTSSVSLILSRDTRNNRLFPSKGTYFSVSQEFAGLGGDNEYYRVIGNERFYRPLFWKVVFKQNFSIGYIKSLNDFVVPLFERFFTGGINSLRGYQLRGVGPSVRVLADPTSGDEEFIIGGNKLLLFNAEFELPIYEPAGFKFVVFYDAGNAFAEDENFSITNLRHDYGFGMRWNSPFGPMRFEWGFPINKRPGDDSVVFNFTIGSFF
jgi:outer membrane protein insertion porin family